jgi:hypothetical protein
MLNWNYEIFMTGKSTYFIGAPTSTESLPEGDALLCEAALF